LGPTNQGLHILSKYQNLKRSDLGLTFNRVYRNRLRLLLEEYSPKIVHIPGVHNSVVVAISRLEYDPKVNPSSHHMYVHKTSAKTDINMTHLIWKAVSKCLTNSLSECHSSQRDTPNNNSDTEDQIRLCFANRDKEEDIIC